MTEHDEHQDEHQNEGAQLTPEEEVRAQILGETAKIAWKELQRFFAQGVVIMVRPGLDLVEVALEISKDNEEQVKAWMGSGEIAGVTDEQAQEWLEANALMWAVVVKPWVMVQPIMVEH